MHGTKTIPFSELFADTVRRHGLAWAHSYYIQRGMPSWEFGVWLRGL